jgi:hypothetical protein
MPNYTVTITRVTRVTEETSTTYRNADDARDALLSAFRIPFDEHEWSEVGNEEVNVDVAVTVEREKN